MLLSVIIPIYNVEQYIKECFDSLCKQPGADIEYICIDDGSTDNSGKICDEYAKRDNRFVVIHHTNKGVSAARNQGLLYARGSYLAYVDPDDFVSDEWYINIKECVQQTDCDILIFDYKIIKNNKKIDKQYKNESGKINTKEFLYDIVDDQKIQSQLWQKVFKRELFDGIVFPTNVVCMEDYAVLHDIIEKSKNIYYMQNYLYFYRVRNDGLVKSINLDKSYFCYRIAKNRYESLNERYPDIRKIGYLMQAMGFCLQYSSLSKAECNGYQDKYIICYREVSNNLKELLMSRYCGSSIKIKFILCYFELLGIAYAINNYIKRKLK